MEKYYRTPTFRLLAGLAVTLSAVAVYSAYTVYQLRALERLQAATIDRNRTDFAAEVAAQLKS